MDEQNFDQFMIDENVVHAIIPCIDTARTLSRVNTLRQNIESDPCLIQQDINAVKNKELFKPNKPKRLNSNLVKQKQFKEYKLLQKKKELQEIQNQNCTFKPKIKDNGRQRSLKEFLDSQQKFMKKVNDKKQNLKVQLSEQKLQQTFKPKTNKTAFYRKQPVYQRLYNLRNKQPQNLYQEPVNNFKPIIAERSKNLARQLPIAQLLYNDALRRQQVQKQKHHRHSQLDEKVNATNQMNQRYVAQKFIKEYYVVLQELRILDTAGQIDIEMYANMLRRMNFIKNQDRITDKQKLLLAQSFEFLNSVCISIKNICVFLMALVGIYGINPINFQVEENQKAELNLDQIQGRRLQKKYQIFFRNRLYAQDIKKSNFEEVYTFKPQINPQSESLAENHRNKMLQQASNLLENRQIHIEFPKDGMINHIDLLHYSKIAKDLQCQKKREQNKDNDLKSCTFKPTLHESKKSMNCSHVTDFEGKKYEQLYNLSKQFNKLVKTSSEIQYQKNQKQCTFVPKINKKPTVKQPLKEIKDLDKTIVRMAQARKQKQEKNKILGINYEEAKSRTKSKSTTASHHASTSSQKTAKKQKQTVANTMQKDFISHQNEVPYLVIDVNLGEQTQQISIYKNQITKPEKIAEQFSRKHQLDSDSQQRLLGLLKMEISSILNKIEEQDQEFD